MISCENDQARQCASKMAALKYREAEVDSLLKSWRCIRSQRPCYASRVVTYFGLYADCNVDLREHGRITTFTSCRPGKHELAFSVAQKNCCCAHVAFNFPSSRVHGAGGGFILFCTKIQKPSSTYTEMAPGFLGLAWQTGNLSIRLNRRSGFQNLYQLNFVFSVGISPEQGSSQVNNQLSL